MIYESHVWKDILKRNVRQIKKTINKLNQKKHLENSQNDDYNNEFLEKIEAELEIFLFSSFFIVRKLIDSYKLSDEIKTTVVKCKFYPKKTDLEKIENQSILNYRGPNIDPEKQYDFTLEKDDEIQLVGLCNMMVHSFLFYFSYKEIENYTQPDFLFLNTDNNKDKRIYKIELEKLIKLIESASKDEVVSASIHRDEKGKIVVEQHNYYNKK